MLEDGFGLGLWGMAKYSKNAIRKLTGEDYPFGGLDEQQGSFAEMFDPQRFDRLEERYRRQEPAGLAPFSAKNYPPPQETLDLHGATGQEAETLVHHCLRRARQGGVRTVRIITGKGLHSPGGKAVLPDVVEQLLRLKKQKGELVEFRWEKRQKAKSGAVLVYL